MLRVEASAGCANRDAVPAHVSLVAFAILISHNQYRHEQSRQRRAQFMGDVGGGLLFPREGALQEGKSFGQAVHDGPQFDGQMRIFELQLKVPGGNATDGHRQPLERRKPYTHEPDTAHYRGGKGSQADEQQPVSQGRKSGAGIFLQAGQLLLQRLL